MNQKQKRQRVNRMRNEQKKAREAKRPKPRMATYEDLVGLLSMVRGFMRSEQNLIFLHEERLKKLMKIGTVSMLIFVSFFLMVTFKILYVSNEWVGHVLTAVFILCMIPWIEYFLHDDWLLLHWKKELKNNTDFAEGLKERL